ncbi:integral membrane protein [Streptococcus pneumoniae]|nr:integral membrane protein [Streptococcus pneumoniae]
MTLLQLQDVFLLKKRSFYYPKFIKFFWRAGFLLTLIMYIEMIVELFLMK